VPDLNHIVKSEIDVEERNEIQSNEGTVDSMHAKLESPEESLETISSKGKADPIAQSILTPESTDSGRSKFTKRKKSQTAPKKQRKRKITYKKSTVSKKSTKLPHPHTQNK